MNQIRINKNNLKLKFVTWLQVLRIRLLTKYTLWNSLYSSNSTVSGSISKQATTIFNNNRSKFILIVLPTILAVFYYLFFVSVQYQSSTEVVVRQNGGEILPTINLGFLGSSGGAQAQNAYLLENYIQSRAMLNYLNKTINLRKVFESHSIDIFSRMWSSDDDAQFLKYYQSLVNVTFSTNSSSLLISAVAFTPTYAKKMLDTILAQSKIFINKVAHSLANQQLQFAQKEFAIAKEKLTAAENDMLEFQNRHKLFSPDTAATTASTVLSTLQSNLVKLQTQLINLKSYMQPNSSRIVSVEQQIEAVKQQMQDQDKNLLGYSLKNANSATKLNTVIARYSWLKLRLQFATAEYQAAQQAVMAAKVNVAKDQNALIEIEKPNLPDHYSYPRKLYNIISILIGLSMLYMIGKMIVIIIQEHRD